MGYIGFVNTLLARSNTLHQHDFHGLRVHDGTPIQWKTKLTKSVSCNEKRCCFCLQ